MIKKHKGLKLLSLGIGAAAGFCFLVAPDRPDLNKERFWQYMCCFRYAHRGLYNNQAGVPENSCAAFRAARKAGFGSELDVHICKDGSLAVIHDSDLARMCKSSRIIEDMSRDEYTKTMLLDTQESIPEFKDVLEIYSPQADGQACGTPLPPLIIELKVYKGNYLKLCEAVADALDGFKGEFCIESFDPRAVEWFKKHRPQIFRGQLGENLIKRPPGDTPFLMCAGATYLLGNILSRPDFIAYNLLDRKNPALRTADMMGAHRVFWTITNNQDMEFSEKNGSPVIFEGFVPDSVSEIPV